MGYRWRRMTAFLVDVIFVLLISYFTYNNKILNPQFDDLATANGMLSVIYSGERQILLESNYKGINKFIKNTAPFIQEVEKNSIFVYLWVFIYSFLYFCIFQFYTGGQTIGKKIMGLRIVNKGSYDIGIKNLFGNLIFNGNLFITPCFLASFIILGLSCIIKSSYIFAIVDLSILLLGFIYFIINGLFMLIKKDHRSLSNIISKTEVVDSKVV